MSYILDALRKSQQARQPGTAPRTGAVHNITLALPVSGWWYALGVVLLLGILVAALLFWRSTVARLPDPPAVPASTEPVADTPPVSTPSPVALEKSAAIPKPPARKNTPVVTDLAEQARLPAPAPPPKKIVAARPEKKAAANRSSATVKTAAPAPALPLIVDDTPLLQQMPQDFRHALPELAVTIHVYSHDESQRILFINNREYRKGSQITGDIRVEDIVADGAVLSFRGERFKLSRPR